jgi:hypothetical protein
LIVALESKHKIIFGADMTKVIATLALLTSILLLIVHYKNQVERRYGEIAKLRSDYLRRLATIHQRYISIKIHFETIRIELRRTPDCDDKYESIENMPKLIDGMKEAIEFINRIKTRIDTMDTRKYNKSKILLTFQTLDADIQSIEDNASDIEQSTLRMLEKIRTMQEQSEKQG